MNPVAIGLWVVTTGVGYLITGTLKGAIAGLLVGVVISLIAEFTT